MIHKKIHRLIKRFIIWYIASYCQNMFRYRGKVVRVFSIDYYEEIF